MKIIDIFNKIANGEEVPKKIKYNDTAYTYHERIEKIYGSVDEQGTYLEEQYYITGILNHEVEIIEEDKKIEKLNLDKDELLKNVIITAQDYVIEGKINELIDEVNKLKGDKNEK